MNAVAKVKRKFSLGVFDKNGILDTTRCGQLIAIFILGCIGWIAAVSAWFLSYEMIINKVFPTSEQLSSLGQFMLVGCGPSGVFAVAFSGLYQVKRKIVNGAGMPHQKVPDKIPEKVGEL